MLTAHEPYTKQVAGHVCPTAHRLWTPGWYTRNHWSWMKNVDLALEFFDVIFLWDYMYIYVYSNFCVIYSTYIDILRLEKKVCWWWLSYIQDGQQFNPIPPFCVWLWILLLLTVQPVYWDKARAIIFLIVNSVECWQRTCFSILWKQIQRSCKKKGDDNMINILLVLVWLC